MSLSGASDLPLNNNLRAAMDREGDPLLRTGHPA
jgi:hypothetical protein